VFSFNGGGDGGVDFVREGDHRNVVLQYSLVITIPSVSQVLVLSFNGGVTEVWIL
jgi:hypothetical protein